MTNNIVLYHSGYGHTAHVADYVAKGAKAKLIAIDAEGSIPEAAWEELASAQAIIFGSPVYMGNVSWQFKKFADASSKFWMTRGWQDKVFGGFVNSGSLNGDKEGAIRSLQTLAMQHGGIWVSLGLLPSNTLEATREDINNLGGSLGVLVYSPTGAGVTAISSGDLETAKLYGERVAHIAARFNAGACRVS